MATTNDKPTGFEFMGNSLESAVSYAGQKREQREHEASEKQKAEDQQEEAKKIAEFKEHILPRIPNFIRLIEPQYVISRRPARREYSSVADEPCLIFWYDNIQFEIFSDSGYRGVSQNTFWLVVETPYASHFSRDEHRVYSEVDLLEKINENQVQWVEWRKDHPGYNHVRDLQEAERKREEAGIPAKPAVPGPYLFTGASTRHIQDQLNKIQSSGERVVSIFMESSSSLEIPAWFHIVSRKRWYRRLWEVIRGH